MAQFPATEGDQLVTRDHLRAELAEVRTEITELRGPVGSEIAAARRDLADLRSDLGFRFTGTLLGALVLATAIIAFG